MNLLPRYRKEDCMKIKYRERYIQNLYACLHTLSAKCDSCNEAAADSEKIVKTSYPVKVRGQNRYEHYLMLNPNNSGSEQLMIRSYSDFNRVLQKALERMEVQNFRITRADLCFNSDELEDYELFKKLNRLLICCIADAENIKNCYKTSDLWSDKSLSVAVKNDAIEVENYDKSVENPNVATKNRLEFRSKRMKGTLQEEFTGKWFARLDKALEHFELVQERYNQELYKLWIEDRARESKDQSYLSLTAFLMQYKDCIYTRKQLEGLLELMGVENPQRKAKNFKDRHTIEFYSKTDLRLIIEAIKDATVSYFTS
jgi:hypothetical protein